MTTEKILKVHELTKIFPHPSLKNTNIPIFGSASFQLTSSKPNFIIGVSGSGKTTLFRILASLESIDAGEIFLDDLAIHLLQGQSKRDYLKSIGFLDQFPAKFLALNLTVRENLDYILLIKTDLVREERKKRIDEITKKFDIYQLHETKTLYLSGGELRRLSLAYNMVFEPILLLCDEPTSQLDLENKTRILKNIQALNESFDSLIFIATHDRNILNKNPTYEIKERRIVQCQ
ncbi:MAG TPA: ATP-binding cassette domain-containing protein [candidate division Zixibacteria bacterium]|nr:ATP-binding cassette domain-containing protein [candidate division Zixibacteria bacterium]